MATTDAAISVMSSEEPFKQALPRERSSNTGFVRRSRDVLLVAKYMIGMTAARICPAAVASAAPTTPQPNTPMNT